MTAVLVWRLVKRGLPGDTFGNEPGGESVFVRLAILGTLAAIIGLGGGPGVGRLFGFVELALFAGAGLALGTMIALFRRALTVPTLLGRERLDAIEGLALYLSVAEADRLELLHPPDRTAAHFEELLPYAIAFGLARSWTRQFAHALATTRPAWYAREAGQSDDDWDWLAANEIERDIGATRWPAPAPLSSSSGGSDWSSSGSGGGGSSGGGGGGGSTRGW